MTLQTGHPPGRVDTLVVGSGFGGSVVAAKLAERADREGRSGDVCVVERGKAYAPNDFPRTPKTMATNFWNTRSGLHGLFDVWNFMGFDAVVASGLGGGSLIYANVMLRKDESWFTQPHPYRRGVTETWSFTRKDLDPHYDAVAECLSLQTYPGDQPFQVPKAAAFRAAAPTGMAVQSAPLAVRFDGGNGPEVGAPLPAAPYGNIHGAHRRTCRLIGECDLGCNEGAKSSMDHTFLSIASDHGASIHTCTEVRRITKHKDHFAVEVLLHTPGATGEPPTKTITARRVVLAAGTFGSTNLLLCNRASLGLRNPALGTRFCGNGDLLSFVIDARNRDDDIQPSRGPVITSYLRFDDGHGMYIEDAGVPAFAEWLVDMSQLSGRVKGVASLVGQRLWWQVTGKGRSSLSRDLAKIVGPGTFGARVFPLLGMGRDVPDGMLYLREQDGETRLDSTWTTGTSLAYFDAMVARMRAMAHKLGGRFVMNPSWLRRRVITVHPLGGCPADTTESEGVVDTYGRVKGVENLWVCDGSVMPGPVGANPSFTIAAFAHRAAEQMVAEPAGAWPAVAQDEVPV
ncbi:GMC oxidoreductase [Mycobacterium sp. MYCO198283]|uniref:GMC oxidoreductase n=1 Tax=Mycobacterium sp. MYCO198283 TaxID=2883505 RepID=UPI001E5D7729|nr:GMC oxidoreductase [Mycobacterium sp. MYCO198283]MCG5433353.1 GMC oxidoreductase [Mycobacterium sp. MYCO198283]